MNIKKEIFDKFFKNLEDNDSIPPKLFQELKKMFEESNSITQSSITIMIRRLVDNDNQD